jgi:two-component system phosphate regulon response regulator PhoB
MRRKQTILVVEDDPQLRRLYWQALTFEGFHVITAEDGQTALECLDHQLPALVVLDLNVPRISGWDIHRELMSKPETRTIPVIVVTAADPADVVTQAAALLVKPVSVYQVVEEIYRHVEAPAA